MFKTYNDSDYVFTNPDGTQYISTPEYNYWFDISIFIFMGATIPVLIGGILWINF